MLEKCKKSQKTCWKSVFFGLLFCVYEEIILSLPSIIDVSKYI